MNAGMNKVPYLAKFCTAGYYLIDLSEIPVNPIERAKARNAVLERNKDAILSLVKELRPNGILLIKRNVHDILHPVLAEEYAVVNAEFIPFPASGQQRKFRELVRKYLGIK